MDRCCILSLSLVQEEEALNVTYRRIRVLIHRMSFLKMQVRNPITGLDSPLGFEEFEAPWISKPAAREGGKVSPTHRPRLPPRNFLGTHFC